MLVIDKDYNVRHANGENCKACYMLPDFAYMFFCISFLASFSCISISGSWAARSLCSMKVTIIFSLFWLLCRHTCENVYTDFTWTVDWTMGIFSPKTKWNESRKLIISRFFNASPKIFLAVTHCSSSDWSSSKVFSSSDTLLNYTLCEEADKQYIKLFSKYFRQHD